MVLAAPPVLPEPPVPADPIELTWVAPDDCPQKDAVQASISGAAGELAGARLRATGTVVAEDDTFTLTLTLDDGVSTESRTVRSGDCAALGRAAGLVIAVALDPVAVAIRLREREEASLARVTEEPPPAEPPREVPPPRPSRPEPRDAPAAVSDDATRTVDREAPRRSTRARASPPVRIAVRPELLVGGGLLPQPVGIGLAGALAIFGRTRPWRAELAGAYWLARRATIPETAAGGDLWLAHARASGCGVPRTRRVEFPICGGVDLGAVGGRGFGPGVATRADRDLFVALHLGAGVAWAPIDRLALVARLEGVAPVRRPGFVLVGVGVEEVHRVGAIGARGAFGLEVRFF